MAFRACPECGATVHDRFVEVHQGWHDEQAETPEAPELQLQPWPAELDSRPGV